MSQIIDPIEKEMLELQVGYVDDSIDTLGDFIEKLTGGAGKKFDIDEVFRLAHSIKGTAGTYGFGVISQVTGHLENILSAVRERRLNVDKETFNFIVSAFEQIQEAFMAIKNRYALEKRFCSDGLGVETRYAELLGSVPAILRAFPLPVEGRASAVAGPERPVWVSGGRAVIAYNAKFTKGIVRGVLEDEGYEVFETRSGVEALDKLYETGAGLLVTFQLLDKMSGQGLCAAVKISSDLAGRKVIFITSNRNATFVSEAGPDGIVYVDDGLEESVRKALKSLNHNDRGVK